MVRQLPNRYVLYLKLFKGLVVFNCLKKKIKNKVLTKSKEEKFFYNVVQNQNGGNSYSKIVSYGNNNGMLGTEIKTDQTGFGNSATIEEGLLGAVSFSAASIAQNGNFNTSSISQEGGSYNSAAVVQGTDSNSATVSQTGANNVTTVIQN